MGLISAPPASNEIEVSVFGPGFGECSVIHIGDGHWVIVDSCIDALSKEPAALKYLRSIGAGANCVDLIVATHWHDDHVRGLSQLIQAFPHARVCVSSILTNQEFVTSIIAHDERPLTQVTSGVHEMKRVLDLQQGKGITRAVADRRVFQRDGFSHGNAVEVWTLSPGDVAYDRFIQSLEKLMPRAGEQKRRVPVLTPNECSVVVLVMIGELAILLGADLEEDSSCKGWSAIIDSPGRPDCKADFFKIPHHGSANAYHPDVWRRMLTSNPVCAVAPYNRGHKLPSSSDVERLLKSGARSYITASVRNKSQKRAVTVDKMLRDLGISIEPISGSTGQIRTRSNGVSHGFEVVDLFNGATDLSKVQ